MVISVSTAGVQDMAAHSRWSCCNSRPRKPPRVLRGERKFTGRMARFFGILGSPARRLRRFADRQSKLAWGNRSTAPIPWSADWERRPATRWSWGEVSQRELEVIFSNCERFAIYWFASCFWPIYNFSSMPTRGWIDIYVDWFLKWQWWCEGCPHMRHRTCQYAVVTAHWQITEALPLKSYYPPTLQVVLGSSVMQPDK